MPYLLDTNACVGYLRGRSVTIRDRMMALPAEEVVLCSVVKAELYYGARKSERPVQNLAVLAVFFERFTSLPFDDPAAEAYGRIRAELEAAGTPIGPNDLLIAAIALSRQVTVVTRNSSEFSRVPGLQCENWEGN
ncbi:MAG: type II toxin-antitoxin system VapC family toxin [Verrucomicrobia bacterium]|nr:type II toxin-antitoxin system VapC family toxin [Verrucomicrobiota bacterium]